MRRSRHNRRGGYKLLKQDYYSFDDNDDTGDCQSQPIKFEAMQFFVVIKIKIKCFTNTGYKLNIEAYLLIIKLILFITPQQI